MKLFSTNLPSFLLFCYLIDTHMISPQKRNGDQRDAGKQLAAKHTL